MLWLQEGTEKEVEGLGCTMNDIPHKLMSSNRYKLAFKDKGATGFHSTLKLTDLRTDGHARKCDEDDRDGEADDDDDDDLVIPIGPVPEEATDLPIEQRVKGKSQYASNDRGLKCYKFSESSLQKYWTKVQEQL